MISQLSKKSISKLYINNKGEDNGFSLIEVAIALGTMGVCLAYAMPLILYSRINNSKSEARAGALMISQKIFDDIRGKIFANIPDTDTTVTYKSDKIITKVGTATETEVAKTTPPEETKALGRNYNVTVRYCELLPAVAPATVGVNECTADYRKFKITIRDTKGLQTSDNSIIYEMEAAFTSFQ
jgi:Tfp pilus assembly protein PilV